MNRRVLIAGGIVILPILGVLLANLGRDPHHIDTPLIGRDAPPLNLREAGSERRISLAQYRGTPVVLNFWATWCVPCFAEHPVLQNGARMSGSAVQYLGVVYDDQEPKILSFLKDYGGAYPVVLDDGGKIAIAYGVTGVPETFFIDAAGKIVAKSDGPLDADSLRRYLQMVAR